MPKIISSPNQQKIRRTFKEGTSIVMTIGAYSYAIDFAYWLPLPRTHIMIGKFCSLARNLVFNVGRNHNIQIVTTFPLGVIDRTKTIPAPKHIVKNPHQIILGHDVWIGHSVTIMGGVKIGNGAVIGANAVVTKDIPPYAVAVGNPARVVKYRFDEETIKKFLAVKWWNWDLKKIADNLPLMTDVEKFLAAHYSPALEDFPEDDITRQLNRASGDVYHFIADFQAQNPLWSKVIEDFQKAPLADAVLVIWLDTESTEEDSKSLTAAVGESKNILTFKLDRNFSPAALRKGTHFITTREMTTLEALDYLWGTDVKIVSALDDGIFSR